MKIRSKRRPHFEPVGLGRQQALAGARFASFRRRALAFVVDFGLMSLGLGLCLLPEALHLQGEAGQYNVDFTMDIDPFHGWSLLSLPLYFGLLTWWGRGQTPGKKWLRIRVVSLAHERLTLWHSVERSLGYGASMLEGGFGFAQYFLHPNRQTVHDRIAETIVIRLEDPAPVERAAPASAPAPPEPAGDVTAQLRDGEPR